MKISTTMDVGPTSRDTATSGTQRASQPIGLPIATATGFSSSHGDGPGLKMNHGASRHSTMDVGPMQAAAGAGFRGQSLCVQFMLRPWWHLLAEAIAASISRSISVEAEASAGFH